MVGRRSASSLEWTGLRIERFHQGRDIRERTPDFCEGCCQVEGAEADLTTRYG